MVGCNTSRLYVDARQRSLREGGKYVDWAGMVLGKLSILLFFRQLVHCYIIAKNISTDLVYLHCSEP